MKAKLIPVEFEFTNRKGARVQSIEKVIFISEGYPEALIHIDSLVCGDLATRLSHGETLDVEITVDEVS